MPIKNTAIVILGASGDLAHRKLIPALSKLYGKNEIDSSNIIIGSGRSDFNDADFRVHFKVSDYFSNLLFYHKGISGLKSYIDSKGNFSKVLFFMALPPFVYESTAEELYNEGFRKESVLIIEKPFGYDYESAKTLNKALHKFYKEKQIFRIDHYLAKEAVQNILVFRFANSIFEPIWNSNYIESIQINATETIGVEGRGAYFDNAGIMRDMVQNHLMQLLCLMTMEAPISLDAEEIRAQKLNILKSLRYDKCNKYQYNGYKDEKGVSPGSTTETYAELVTYIDNFRWAGMPVYIRTGKALHRRGTEIGIRFKKLPKLLFNQQGNLKENQIIFTIQPSEGIMLDLAAKAPGSSIQIMNNNMKYCYSDYFDEDDIPEAYQKLLLDALKGDRTLFVSSEETELSWKKIENIINCPDLSFYEKGELPASKLAAKWIDFDSYGSSCD